MLVTTRTLKVNEAAFAVQLSCSSAPAGADSCRSRQSGCSGAAFGRAFAGQCMQDASPQWHADPAHTQVCALCSSRAGHFHALAVEGSLLEVCGACYYIHELQGLLVARARSADLTDTITVALQAVYEILRSGLSTRSS